MRPLDPDTEFASRTRDDLAIEVWEKLDCESVGSEEIRAIMRVVEVRFGRQAVGSAMALARLLADEGAELRHSEIMELYISQREDAPYDAAHRGLPNISSLKRLRSSLRQMDNLRRKYVSTGDKEGIRFGRELLLEVKQEALLLAESPSQSDIQRELCREAAEWITLWLHSPELFESWVAARTASGSFRRKFGE
jgi:hypothetical protein